MTQSMKKASLVLLMKSGATSVLSLLDTTHFRFYLGTNESRLVGSDDGLRAISQSKLHQDVSDVGFRLGNRPRFQ